jgi:hypothetical protein
MRKLSILLAATLMVSVPLSVTVVTDVYAAAKRVKKAKRVVHRAPAPKAAPEAAGPQPPFAQIVRAIDDLGRQLATSGQR